MFVIPVIFLARANVKCCMPRGKGKNIAVGKDSLTVIILPGHLLEYFLSLEDKICFYLAETLIYLQRDFSLWSRMKDQWLLSIPSEPWKGSQPFPFSPLSPWCYQV